MRTSLLTLPVLSTILACGPGSPGDSDTDPATSTASAGSTEPGTTASSTAEPATTDALPTTATTVAPTSATTDALPTTGVETTDGEGTDATTEPAETATGTSADPSTTTTTDGETDGAPDVAFAAEFWAGGLDHLTVRMAAHKDDFCVELRFARPGDVPPPQPMLPADWWYQGASVSQGAGDCLDFMAPMPRAVAADGVAGLAAWDTEPFCPATIDSIDIVLDFPPDPPWVPAQVTVATESLAVGGC